MLDGIKRKLAAISLMSVLKSLATSNDTKTTVVGLLAGAVLLIPGLDMAQLLAGDPGQIAHVGASLLVAVLGFLATKERHDGHTTLVGTAAGALYAMQGTVETIVTGLIIAILGYFTNKPTEGRHG